MFVSIYSFNTAILYFSLSVLICNFLRQKNNFVVHYDINVLLCFVGLSVFRLCVPLETPVTLVVDSYVILGTIQDILMIEIPIFGGLVPISILFIFIWIIVSMVFLFKLIMRILYDKHHVKLMDLYSIQNDNVSCCMKKIVAKSKQKYRIVISKKQDSPMAIGIVKPIILLPKIVTEMSDIEVHNILMHEWHHIVNKDLVVKLLVELIVCIMWWNPVVYVLKKSIEQILEIKCDLSVTKKMSGMEKFNYLTVLLFVAKGLPKTNKGNSSPLISSNFGNDSSDNDAFLKQRFVVVKEYKTHKPIKTKIVIFIMIIMFVLSYFIFIQAAGQPSFEDILGIDRVTIKNTHVFVKNDGTYWLSNQGYLYPIDKKELAHPRRMLLKRIYE